MKKWENFLKILENKEETNAILFEYKVAKNISQQLVWRSGEHLFKDDISAFSLMADALVLSAMDYGVFDFSENVDYNRLVSSIPNEFKLIAGQKKSVSNYIACGEKLETAFENVQKNYLRAINNDAVIAVSFNENFDDISQKEEVYSFYSNLSREINSLGKKCIWTETGKNPLPINKVIDIGINAVYINEYHKTPTTEILREYSQNIAIFGDTQSEYIKSSKPNDVIEYITSLTQITKNKGFAYGTGNVWGSEFPYLNYISVLTAFLRL